MVNTAKLRGIIAENGMTQQDVAKMLGIAPKTFYGRMKKAKFGSDDIQIMIDELHIENPVDVFFAKEVTWKVTRWLAKRKTMKKERRIEWKN